MAKNIEKEKALLFREQGHSIGEIAKVLNVSKSTVSYWCKNISLSSEQIKQISLRSKNKSVEALLRFSEKQREYRISQSKEDQGLGKRMVKKLSRRDMLMVGLGLYWGEGYKSGSDEFGFTNSDPQMIKFYIIWLEKVFDIKRDRLILRVSINNIHRHRVRYVESRWSEITGVSLNQFTKVSLIKSVSKKVYGNRDEYLGTLRIKVKSGTRIRRRVLGALQALIGGMSTLV